MTTFSGFTSRWMMPCPCACSSASSRLSATRSVSATESRPPLGQELAQGGALDVRHDVVDEPVALARVEQMRDMGMVELGGQLDLSEEPVGRDADQELGVQDLERDRLAARLPRQEDPGVPALADLALDLVASLERLADERQHVAPNDRVLVGGLPNGCENGLTAQVVAGQPTVKTVR